MIIRMEPPLPTGQLPGGFANLHHADFLSLATVAIDQAADIKTRF